MIDPAAVRRFKHDLRDAARAARFESLRDIEVKTGLSRATVSAAFSTTQPLPTEKTVHAIASAIGADASAWTARLRDQLLNTERAHDRPARDAGPIVTTHGTTATAGPEGEAATDIAAPTRVPHTTEDGDADDGGASERDSQAVDSQALDENTADTPPAEPDLGAAAVPNGDDLGSDQNGDPDEGSSGDGGDREGRAHPRRGGLRVAAAVAVGGALIAVGFGAGYLTRGASEPARPATEPSSAGGSGAPIVGLPVGPSRSPGQPAKMIAETVIPENAAPTFKDPLTVRGLGPKVPANTTVMVSCRLFSDAIASAYPDGYWYRIETAPWSGQYYAAANAFLNGDPPGDPTQYKHPTDNAVPVC